MTAKLWIHHWPTNEYIYLKKKSTKFWYFKDNLLELTRTVFKANFKQIWEQNKNWLLFSPPMGHPESESVSCSVVSDSFCTPMDCSPPDSSVHGILQARILEWLPCPSPMHNMKSQREVAQSCPTLCDLMDCSLPGSSIHGIFQARILEWGAVA